MKMALPKSARILIATHSPLSAEFGAGQVAISLAEALRDLGHDVTLWSPHPMPSGIKWWRSLQRMRAKLDEFIRLHGPFDVIDCPTSFITRRVHKSGLVVARSNQPEILYLSHEMASFTRGNRGIKNAPRLMVTYAYTLFRLYLILQGWRRARFILCLGALEYDWMKRRFPWWRSKYNCYIHTLAKSDQDALARVRAERETSSSDARRFIWIGRWASHKGTDVLLDFIKERSARRPQDSFTIAGCGAGPEKDCPADLLGSGRIKIVPSFDRRELYSLLAEHNAGLFTSKVEGWGLSLNEMLESGMEVFAVTAGATVDLQPFFKTLKPFPPPLSSPVESEGPWVGPDYYDAFSWPRIAQRYESFIAEALLQNDQPIMRPVEE